MRKFVSCICICLVLVVAVMPLCAFKCADVPNAPAIVDNRPVMASNRPFVEPVVEPPLYQWQFPPFNETTFNADNVAGTYVLDLTLPAGSMNSGVEVYSPVISISMKFTNCFFVIRDFVSDDVVYSVTVSSSSSLSYLVFVVGQDADGILYSRYNTVNSSGSSNDSVTIPNGYKYLVDFIVLEDGSTITFNTSKTYTYFKYYETSANLYSGYLFSTYDNLNTYYSGLVFYPYVPEPEPTVIETLIDIMVSGISAFAVNIGKGINDVVVNVFVDTSQETFALTTFGGVVAVFAGLALAVGLSKLITSFIMRLGGKE